jgi:hypothetical protein
MISGVLRVIWAVVRGVWAAVEFIGAFIYYLLTEIFVDPFILIKPIKIAAKWLYGNCNRFPIIGLYFSHFIKPEGKHRAFIWLSQTPWTLAIPPALVVVSAMLVKLFAFSLAISRPVLAVVIFVGAKILLVPIALRMWDEARPVVRRDFVLRQIDNVVYFLFHDLPVRAKEIVLTRMRAMKAYLAPIFDPVRVRLRALMLPIRDILRPLGQKLKAVLKAWAAAARRLVQLVFSKR